MYDRSYTLHFCVLHRGEYGPKGVQEELQDSVSNRVPILVLPHTPHIETHHHLHCVWAHVCACVRVCTCVQVEADLDWCNVKDIEEALA